MIQSINQYKEKENSFVIPAPPYLLVYIHTQLHTHTLHNISMNIYILQ